MRTVRFDAYVFDKPASTMAVLHPDELFLRGNEYRRQDRDASAPGLSDQVV